MASPDLPDLLRKSAGRASLEAQIFVGGGLVRFRKLRSPVCLDTLKTLARLVSFQILSDLLGIAVDMSLHFQDFRQVKWLNAHFPHHQRC